VTKPRGLPVVCPVCGKNLGRAYVSDGYPAEWWAEKTIQEHTDEYHDGSTTVGCARKDPQP
jgi:hypothetical protein